MIIDGYEQLGWLAKCCLRMRCRRQQCGLLITAHSAVLGLAIVLRTETSVELTTRLVHELMPGDLTMDQQLIEHHFRRCQGNVRETMLRLYDEFAKRQA